jgi:ATP-dependent Lon protease
MVLTRNQKRKLTDGEDGNENDDKAPNALLITKKQKQESEYSEQLSDSFSEDIMGHSEINETSENDVTSFPSSNTSESQDNADSISEDETGPNKNEGGINIMNMKLTKEQVAEIIKQAVKQILKRYRDNEMEFFTDSQKNNGESDDKEDEYDKFAENIDCIYGGEFFERIPLEDRAKRLKKELTKEQVIELNKQMEDIRKSYKDNAPSIIDVLNMNVSMEQKKSILERFHHLANSTVLSEEYNKQMKFLSHNVNSMSAEDAELVKLEEQIVTRCKGENESFRKKILKSKMCFENKVIAFEKLNIMECYEDTDTSEYAKYKNWMDTLLAIPFGNNIELPIDQTMHPREFLKDVRRTLDSHLSFLENPKDQVINLVAQMVRNPQSKINAIGIYGPRGTGKTSLVKGISDSLNRPYRMISLGGESDNSVLTGHGFTYVGSMPGRIIEILKETQCMNPIILIDELDKISGTQRGQEIIGTLIHMTDSTTNHKYNYDRYFSGIEFDLSKVLFIFTYNDETLVDKILADRLFKIKVDNYNTIQKYEIAQKHIIPNVLQAYGFGQDDIRFSNNSISRIIDSSLGDKGMRDIKRKFEVIVSRINTLLLVNGEDGLINLRYKSLQEEFSELPVNVTSEHVNLLLSDAMTTLSDNDRPPFHMYS